MRYLTIALTKGRLAQKTLDIFEKVGITCEEIRDKNSRKLIFVNEELKLKFFLAKGPDVPTYVEYGAADIGITGKDTIMEEGRRLYEVMDLGFGACRMCVCGPESAKELLHTNQLIRVATKYPNIAKDYFYNKKHQTVEIIKLNGTSYSTYNGGALIMSLSSDASQDEISAAQNGIAAANRTVASAKTVADEKRAHIAELQQKMQNSTVTSPIDGVVVSLNAVEGQEAMIERADVEIISEDIPGWLVANEGRLTVALDITVTENLRKEGLARELVNRIQNLRKSSGYDITDKISVTVLSNDGMDEAIKDFNSYIANQVLAVSVEITDVISDATEMDFEDFKLSVQIEKA